jgi:TonB family protein
MSRSYALYSDTPRRDAERLVKRSLLLTILALHLFVIGLLLRDNPELMQTNASLILIELNALSPVASSTPHKNKDAATISPAKRDGGSSSQKQHTSDVVRSPVAEGNIATNSNRDAETAQPLSGSTSAPSTGSRVGDRATGFDASHHGRFHPPSVQHRWNPLYPWIAYQGNVEGVADVVVTIGADGTLLDARLDHSSGNHALDAATLEAIRHYTFKAGTKDGEAIEAKAIVSIEWRIEPGIKVEVQPMQLRDTHRVVAPSARLIPNLPIKE